MDSLTSILSKKLSHPRFREAAEFAQIKKVAEDFFLDHGIQLRVITFEKSLSLLTVRTFHPALSRDILSYSRGLSEYFLEKKLPSIKKIIVKT